MNLLSKELEAKLYTNPKLFGRSEIYNILDKSKEAISSLEIAENSNKINVSNVSKYKSLISDVFKVIEDIDNKLYFRYHKSDEELIKSSIKRDTKFHYSKLELAEKCKEKYNEMSSFISLDDNRSVDSIEVDLTGNFNRDYSKKLCLKILELLNDIGDIDTNDECKTDLEECNVRYGEVIKQCEDFKTQCLVNERKCIEYNLYIAILFINYTLYRMKLQERLKSYKSLIEETKEYKDISKYGIKSYDYLKSHNSLNYEELTHLNQNIRKSIILIDDTYNRYKE